MSAATQLLVTLAGWAGAISAVVAYGLVTMKRISPDSLVFQGLNIVGAGLLSVSASAHSAWPSAVVNVIWVAIGVYAVRALWNARSASTTSTSATVSDDVSVLTEESSPEEVLAEGWEAPASPVAAHGTHSSHGTDDAHASFMDSLFAGTDVVDPAAPTAPAQRNSTVRTPVAA